jgi:hypothetical protein
VRIFWVIYQTVCYSYEVSFISFATNRLMTILFFIGVHNKFFFFIYIKFPAEQQLPFLFYIYLMLTNHMFMMNDNFFNFFFFELFQWSVNRMNALMMCILFNQYCLFSYINDDRLLPEIRMYGYMLEIEWEWIDLFSTWN